MPQQRIVLGPNKHDLAASLLESSEQYRKVVTFHVAIDATNEIKLSHSVKIESLEREDGSGESWNFTAYKLNGQRIKGWYLSDQRRGVLEVV